MFPGLYINFRSYLGERTNISCTTGSVLRIIDSYIDKGSVIAADHGARLHITKSYIGNNCIVVARDSITIEPDCQIAEMVVIRDQNHRFGAPGKTITEQGFTTAPVYIGKNVWIAAKASVTAGSRIEDNVVVGAHSLVRGRLLANGLYVGAPARRIRSFTDNSPVDSAAL